MADSPLANHELRLRTLEQRIEILSRAATRMVDLFDDTIKMIRERDARIALLEAECDARANE